VRIARMSHDSGLAGGNRVSTVWRFLMNHVAIRLALYSSSPIPGVSYAYSTHFNAMSAPYP
jgi:hypothetical protein